jgi:hypothetical protein
MRRTAALRNGSEQVRKEICITYTPIRVAYPAADDLHLRIALGTCRFEARPGEDESWVGAICHDPTGYRAPIIHRDKGAVTITEEKPAFERIPAVFGGVPRYELEFGKRRPFALTIETGTSSCDLDLGGVPLRALAIKQRAGRLDLDFSAVNSESMSRLEVSSGTAGIALGHLANANFSRMRLSGEAAGYELDFGGVRKQETEQETEVVIETALSGGVIAVPSSTAAKIVAVTTLGSVDVGDGFIRIRGAFATEAAMAGIQHGSSEPPLTIRVGVRQGALQIRAT